MSRSRASRYGRSILVASVVLAAAACERTAESSPHPRQHANSAVDGETDELGCVEITNTSRCWHERCDHMLTLSNGCGSPVDCDVASDVEPGWVRVHLDTGQFFEVTLRHSAESRDFEIRRKCWYYD